MNTSPSARGMANCQNSQVQMETLKLRRADVTWQNSLLLGGKKRCLSDGEKQAGIQLLCWRYLFLATKDPNKVPFVVAKIRARTNKALVN